eukprot:GGOE01021573.1.p1 GENE.GGOE01021573.1~~GGOE01021573.1.p1  ORF type:complete len:143 (+),score=16.98 GGOE01021573.1:61-489(+)
MDLLLKIKGQVGLGEPESAPSTSIWDDMADDFSLFAPAIVLVPKKFAFFFTFGNLFLISSTLFLVGPTRQFRSMMEASRLQATVIYFLSLSMTLVSALRFGSTLLVLVFTCMQIMAMVWYCLSYIPFARTLVRRSCRICRLC